MKKVLSILLTVAIFATMLMSVSAASPAGAYLDVESGEYVADTGIIATEYADINFDDAQLDVSQYFVDGALSISANQYIPYITTNAATESDRVISISTAANRSATNTVAEYPSGSLKYLYRVIENGTNADG